MNLSNDRETLWFFDTSKGYGLKAIANWYDEKRVVNRLKNSFNLEVHEYRRATVSDVRTVQMNKGHVPFIGSNY